MQKISQVVNLVEDKLKILLENYKFLQEENEFLRTKLSILESQLAAEKQLSSQLENDYQALKIAKTIEGSREDRKETKLKINALIREIDACIVQLSD
jgi:hypothetical protein